MPFEASGLISNRTMFDEFLFSKIRNAAGNAVIADVMLVVTWFPTFLVFLIDAQIIFTLFQMIFGVVDGIKQRIGHVNSWSEFDRRLPFLAIAFERRLNATCLHDRPLGDAFKAQARAGLKRHGSATGVFGQNALSRSTQIVNSSASMEEPLSWDKLTDGSQSSALSWSLVTPGGSSSGASCLLSTDSMAHFVQVWNRFVVQLRSDDYLSDREADIYSCLTLHGVQEQPQNLFPSLLMLGIVGSVLDGCSHVDSKYRLAVFGSLESKLNVTKGIWSQQVVNFCREFNRGYVRDGAGEALETCRVILIYLLRALLCGRADEESGSPHANLLQVLDRWSKQAHKLPSGGGWDDLGLSLDRLSPFLQQWFQQPDENQPPGKSKGQLNRKALVAAISALAKGITGLGYKENGTSKQGIGVSFTRNQKGRGFHGQKTIDQMRKLVNDLFSWLKELSGSTDVADAIDVAQNEGFFTDGVLCEAHITALCQTPQVHKAAVYLSHLMSTPRNTAAPRSTEARRRFLSFASSLYMDMPKPKLVEHMRSLTTLTPMYGETVLYTEAEMIQPTGDGRPSMVRSSALAKIVLRVSA